MGKETDIRSRKPRLTPIKGDGGKKREKPYQFRAPDEERWFGDEVVNAYLALAKRACDEWIDDARQIIADYVHPRPLSGHKTTRSSTSFMKYHIKRINRSMNDIKLIMSSLAEAFCDIDQEFKGNLTAFRMILSRFHSQKTPGELAATLERIGSIGRSYQRILEQCRSLGVEFEKFVEISNLDGITILANLKACDLVDILTTKAKIVWSGDL